MHIKTTKSKCQIKQNTTRTLRLAFKTKARQPDFRKKLGADQCHSTTAVTDNTSIAISVTQVATGNGLDLAMGQRALGQTKKKKKKRVGGKGTNASDLQRILGSLPPLSSALDRIC